MKPAPAVTVVVPLYNKERWIERTLKSISAQTFRDFEGIIVDDGSTDRGPDIAAAFADDRFRLVRQPNGGPGAARNTGIRESSTELVSFLDADDEWHPDYLSAAVQAFEDHPQIQAFTSGHLLNPGSRSTAKMWRERGIREGVPDVQQNMSPLTLVHMLAFMHPCTTVLRRGAALRWRGFYELNRCKYAEDAYLMIQLLLNETVWFDLTARASINRDAAELSADRSKPHPLEPFLEDPGPIRQACPARLRQALEDLLRIRAFKTACAWSYAGEWREARRLRQRFANGGRGLKYYWMSLFFSTPVGATLGAGVRTVLSWRGSTAAPRMTRAAGQDGAIPKPK